MSKTSYETGNPLNMNLNEVAASNQNSLMAMVKSYNKWILSTGQIQSELLEFVGMRIKKDIEAPQRLAECGDAADLIAQQMEFANTMMKDYATENQKILKLISEAAQDIELEAETALTDADGQKAD